MVSIPALLTAPAALIPVSGELLRSYAGFAPPQEYRPYTLSQETHVWKKKALAVSDGPDPRDWVVRKSFKRELAETGVLDIPKGLSLFANNLVTMRRQFAGGNWSDAAAGNPFARWFIGLLYSDKSYLANWLVSALGLDTIKLVSDSIEGANNLFRLGPPSITALQSHNNLRATDGVDRSFEDEITRLHHEATRTVLSRRRIEASATLAQRLATMFAPFALAFGMHDWYLASYMFGVTALLTSYGTAVLGVAPTADAAQMEHLFKDTVAYNVKPPLILAHAAHERFARALALKVDAPELFELKLLNHSLARAIDKARCASKPTIRQRLRVLAGKAQRPKAELDVTTLERLAKPFAKLEVAYTSEEIDRDRLARDFQAAKDDLVRELGSFFELEADGAIPTVRGHMSPGSWVAAKLSRKALDYRYLRMSDLVRRLEILLDSPSSHGNEVLPAFSERVKSRIRDAITSIDDIRYGKTDEHTETVMAELIDDIRTSCPDEQGVVQYLTEIGQDYLLAQEIYTRTVRVEVARGQRRAFNRHLENLREMAERARAEITPHTLRITRARLSNTFLAGAYQAFAVGVGLAKKPEPVDERAEFGAIGGLRDQYFTDAVGPLYELEELCQLAESGLSSEPARVSLRVVDSDVAVTDDLALNVVPYNGGKIADQLVRMRRSRSIRPSTVISVASLREAENIVKFATVAAFTYGAIAVFDQNDMGFDFLRGLVGYESENPKHDVLTTVVQGRIRGGLIFPLTFFIPLAVTTAFISAKNFLNVHFNGNAAATLEAMREAWRRRSLQPAAAQIRKTWSDAHGKSVATDSVGFFGTLLTTESMGKPIGDIILASVRMVNSFFLGKENKK